MPQQPPTPVPVVEVPEPPEPPVDPNALAAKFRAEQDADVRSEIVSEFWDLGTPEAVEMLRILFLGERSSDVKADILAGIADVSEKTTRVSCYGLLLSAIAPGQPPDVRLLAAHLCTDFDDARVPGLLQQFSQDPDPEVREAIKDAIEELRQNQER